LKKVPVSETVQIRTPGTIKQLCEVKQYLGPRAARRNERLILEGLREERWHERLQRKERRNERKKE